MRPRLRDEPVEGLNRRRVFFFVSEDPSDDDLPPEEVDLGAGDPETTNDGGQDAAE